MKSNVEIGLLKETEIPQALELIRANYSEGYAGYAKPELEAMFRPSAFTPQFVAARLEGRLVGLAAYIESPMDWSVYELFWVGVLPEFQRQGIGAAVATAAIEQIKARKGKAPLAAIVLTTSKKEFWETLGFKVIAPLLGPYVFMSLAVEDARTYEMPEGYLKT